MPLTKENIVSVYLPLFFMSLAITIFIMDRRLSERFLYLITGILWVAEIITFIIQKLLPLGYGNQYPYLIFLPFIWLITLFGAIPLTIYCIFHFFQFHAHDNIPAMIGLIIIYILLALFSIYCLFIFIAGILSLKSG
ncbi:MAG: hypothetical protein ACTTKU_02250 [Eggerthia catenaformis]|uniref:hypothetical protein n=1 Tax=Eggerthia catenaformis TaxID=31973 RepID=UPI003F9ED308